MRIPRAASLSSFGVATSEPKQPMSEKPRSPVVGEYQNDVWLVGFLLVVDANGHAILIGTRRLVGRWTASAIASASGIAA